MLITRSDDGDFGLRQSLYQVFYAVSSPYQHQKQRALSDRRRSFSGIRIRSNPCFVEENPGVPKEGCLFCDHTKINSRSTRSLVRSSRSDGGRQMVSHSWLFLMPIFARSSAAGVVASRKRTRPSTNEAFVPPG